MSRRAFEDLVREVGHPKVALVLIGLDRTANRGMVGTNLGLGLDDILTRKEAADLFLAEGEEFSPSRLRVGVDRLASRLEEWSRRTRARQEDLFPEAERRWYQRLGVPLVPFLALGLFGVFAAWRAWRAKLCPSCGAVMRTRVRLGGPGGGAVRTRKCFECGHVTKQRYDRWGAGKTRRARRGTPES